MRHGILKRIGWKHIISDISRLTAATGFIYFPLNVKLCRNVDHRPNLFYILYQLLTIKSTAMPRVHKRKARQNIYTTGLRTKNPENKSGWSLERTKPADENDLILIAKGQEYYTWQIKGQAPRYSPTKPKRSQLTTSAYLGAIYDLQDADYPADENIISIVDDVRNELEQILDEVQTSFDNMPEQLQGAPTGELLQERIDQVSEAISNIESIDLDIDEELTEEEVAEVYESICDQLIEAISNL